MSGQDENAPQVSLLRQLPPPSQFSQQDSRGLVGRGERELEVLALMRSFRLALMCHERSRSPNALSLGADQHEQGQSLWPQEGRGQGGKSEEGRSEERQ